MRRRAGHRMNRTEASLSLRLLRGVLVVACAGATPLLSACSSDDDIDLAINAAKRYVSLYPTNPDAAYAQYIVGLCYFKQIRDVTQDQKEARKTIEAMNDVVQRWPDSEYVEDAQAKI